MSRRKRSARKKNGNDYIGYSKSFLNEFFYETYCCFL